jgi:cobalamin-dependent methionine synthase I
MIIVGELINGSRELIARAVTQRDSQAILRVARAQVDAGAHILDINAGTDPEREVDDLPWLVETVLGDVNIPLCIDSPHAKSMEAGLKKGGKRAVMVNSITGQKSRLESFLPLVKAHGTQVIALCMDDEGVPQKAGERLKTAAGLVEKLTDHGVEPARIFLDPLVCPVSVDAQAGRVARDTLRLIKEHLPEVKTICGLSNISFGLPNRHLLNRNFLSIMQAEGLDAAILDPTDKALMINLATTQTLMGGDEHCLNYISAHRQGKLL